jgi:hypothetical protein
MKDVVDRILNTYQLMRTVLIGGLVGDVVNLVVATMGSPLTPEVGAVCGKAARTDLCGGREVTRVPTAKRSYLLRCISPVVTRTSKAPIKIESSPLSDP